MCGGEEDSHHSVVLIGYYIGVWERTRGLEGVEFGGVDSKSFRFDFWMIDGGAQ